MGKISEAAVFFCACGLSLLRGWLESFISLSFESEECYPLFVF